MKFPRGTTFGMAQLFLLLASFIETDLRAKS